MIICSCNQTETDDIEYYIRMTGATNVAEVLRGVGWQANCSTCCDLLVSEVKKAMENVNG